MPPSPLETALIARIQASGALTVADYMEACIFHYYATRDPFGQAGDFTTAPEISQIFGELIGAWLADNWQRLGSPRAMLAELGPGRGTLMKDILRATRAIPGFHDHIEIHLVETSPALREVQKQTLGAATLHWHDTIDSLPSLPLFLVANEFFDALPVHHYVMTETGEEERKVTHNAKSFSFLPQGAVCRESSPASLAVIRALASHITRFGGVALIIDYGYVGGSSGDTLQAIRRHACADPLAAPGEADLTAHVDFTALLNEAQKTGAYTHGAVEQGIFLKRLGAELRALALCKSSPLAQHESILCGLARLVAPDAMGSLFKAIALTSTLDKPAGF